MCVPTVVVVVRCSRANRACFEKSAPLPLYGLSRGRRTPSSSVLFPAALSPREPAFPCLFFFFQVPPPSSPYAVSSVERERDMERNDWWRERAVMEAPRRRFGRTDRVERAGFDVGRSSCPRTAHTHERPLARPFLFSFPSFLLRPLVSGGSPPSRDCLFFFTSIAPIRAARSR